MKQVSGWNGAERRVSLRIPRDRPRVSEAVIGWGIGLLLFWTVIWICFR